MANPSSEFSGLNHVTIKVHSIKTAVNFYVDKLGFKVTRVVGPGMISGATRNFGGCFIRCRNLHHDVVLMYSPKGAEAQHAPSALVSDHGMHHFSLRVGSKEEFEAWVAYCEAEDIEIFWAPAVHSTVHPEGDGFFGEHRGFFISDPSGNHIQILCDMAEIDPGTNGVDDSWFRDRLERDGLDRSAADPPPAWETDFGFLES